MIKINLLPWREDRKILALNRYIALLIFTVILSIIILVMARTVILSSSQVYSYYDQVKLNQGISSLKNKIKQMHTYERQYNDLRKFTGIIEEMHISPIILLEALKEIPKSIPDTVKVKRASFNGQLYVFNGQTISQKEIFRFMENLKTLKFVKNVELQNFNQAGDSSVSFTIKVFITYKEKS